MNKYFYCMLLLTANLVMCMEHVETEPAITIEFSNICARQKIAIEKLERAHESYRIHPYGCELEIGCGKDLVYARVKQDKKYTFVHKSYAFPLFKLVQQCYQKNEKVSEAHIVEIFAKKYPCFIHEFNLCKKEVPQLLPADPMDQRAVAYKALLHLAQTCPHYIQRHSNSLGRAVYAIKYDKIELVTRGDRAVFQYDRFGEDLAPQEAYKLFCDLERLFINK